MQPEWNCENDHLKLSNRQQKQEYYPKDMKSHIVTPQERKNWMKAISKNKQDTKYTTKMWRNDFKESNIPPDYQIDVNNEDTVTQAILY